MQTWVSVCESTFDWGQCPFQFIRKVSDLPEVKNQDLPCQFTDTIDVFCALNPRTQVKRKWAVHSVSERVTSSPWKGTCESWVLPQSTVSLWLQHPLSSSAVLGIHSKCISRWMCAMWDMRKHLKFRTSKQRRELVLYLLLAFTSPLHNSQVIKWEQNHTSI